MSVFLTCIEQNGREIYETFNFYNPGDEMRLASVLLEVFWILQPKEEHQYTSSKVFTYRQHEGQNFHDFVTELKKMSIWNSPSLFNKTYDCLWHKW